MAFPGLYEVMKDLALPHLQSIPEAATVQSLGCSVLNTFLVKKNTGMLFFSLSFLHFGYKLTP